jgi:hypothetical protein
MDLLHIDETDARIGDGNILEASPHYCNTYIENSEWEEMSDQFIIDPLLKSLIQNVEHQMNSSTRSSVQKKADIISIEDNRDDSYWYIQR